MKTVRFPFARLVILAVTGTSLSGCLSIIGGSDFAVDPNQADGTPSQPDSTLSDVALGETTADTAPPPKDTMDATFNDTSDVFGDMQESSTDSTSDSQADSTSDTKADSTSDAQGPVINVSISGTMNVWSGNPVSLSATASAGGQPLTYLWQTVSLPSLATVAFSPNNGASTTFTASAPGTYVIKVIVTSQGNTKEAQISVNVVDPPIFTIWAQNTSLNSLLYRIQTRGARYGAVNEVYCPSVGPARRDGGLNDNNNNVVNLGRFAADVYESGPGTPSMMAFVGYDISTGDQLRSIRIVRSNGSCSTPSIRVSSIGQANIHLFQPKFSSNGQRIVFYKAIQSDSPTDPGHSRLAYEVWTTDTVDGQTERKIANYSSIFYYNLLTQYDTHPESATSYLMPRPVFFPDGKVGWVRSTTADNTAWEIMSASDVTSPTPVRYMYCAGRLPRQIEVLANGNILASANAGAGGTPPQHELHQYKPQTDAAKTCSVVSKLTSHNSVVRDFDISPTGDRIAYLIGIQSIGNNMNAGTAYIGDFNGTTLNSKPLGGASTAPMAFSGPRFAGGGSVLSLGYVNKPTSVYQFSAGVAYGSGAPLTGTNPEGIRILAQGNRPVPTDAGEMLNDFHTVGNSGGSCTMGHKRNSADFMTIGLCTGLMVWAIRRRRPKS